VTRARTRTARELRRHETTAERVLWELVRGRKLLGSKFRRQAPIGRFIVDFLCHERARVVEADGPIHVDRVEYDAEREAWLARQGFTVLRFSNAQVLSEPHAVQRRILATPPGGRAGVFRVKLILRPLPRVEDSRADGRARWR
jgi:very-short-patch-repair endonuclease